ncbi:hypothetical protein H8356DRAFT_1724269 [Neocallimastix lanati (nom. inval.)]|jgi:intraflagellar transport protein 52|uniref:ABC-type uncharacterized transport system domain-containing protein n=1 Tax=Neocallimastix californiae TaxID=1754190 RepID=A0A1Y2AF34_9FUNG|nr:hypothetical protein H8356DRAFT_1724269 [Neocallimastix sp. JGI-2020a]ORY21181.1 hypothetical protein LY90DRAFT_676370 [Neocallimastix californiae]|eukprot:ORY21181.1 hypothetical protein LY90DRAFT_676370 [Neocallimastix californiae]
MIMPKSSSRSLQGSYQSSGSLSRGSSTNYSNSNLNVNNNGRLHDSILSESKRDLENSKSQLPTILFNVTKKELATPSNGFKLFQRRLRNSFKISLNKEELNPAKLKDVKLIIFGGPREKFTTSEFSALKTYIENGGSIFYMTGEGGENQYNTNFNYLLEEYGIMTNLDAVTRTVYYKYHHPKEVFIANGILNREINRAAGKKIGTLSYYSTSTSLSEMPVTENSGGGLIGIDMATSNSNINNNNGKAAVYESNYFNPNYLSVVYPYGATLNVQKPAIPILSSGNVSFPLNRPVAAFSIDPVGYGKVAVVGSILMFSDQYIDKEENGKFLDVIIQWLTTDKIELNSIDANEPDISDYHYLPETIQLSNTLKSCLQESDEIPKDFTTMFDTHLFKLDTSLIPEAIKLYDTIHLKHEPLTLIQPQFETPLPPLQPAVFAPVLKDLPPPALDLFDLDENFASERVRLAQLTNKCSDKDLEYYIWECGKILGVMDKLEAENKDARHVLEYIFKQIVSWKKLNQEL